MKNTPKTGFIGYTNKLTEYVISETKEKKIGILRAIGVNKKIL